MNDLKTPGYMLTGTFCSFTNITLLQSLFTIKSRALAGKKISIQGLYNGYGANLASDLSNQPVNFYAFGGLKHLYQKHWLRENRNLTDREEFALGIPSGAVCAVGLSSIERIMILQQIEMEKQKNAFTKTTLSIPQYYKTIYKIEGAKGLFKGIIPTICRESTNSALFFGLSKMIQPTIETSINIKNKNDKQLAVRMLSCGISGILAGLITVPFDYTKTQIQKDITTEKTSGIQLLKSYFTVECKTNPRNALIGALARAGLSGVYMSIMGGITELLPPHLPPYFHKPKTPE